MGYIATTLGAFMNLLSRRQQPWVWYIVYWTDGTSEDLEEDYPPWMFVTEIQNGYFDGPDSTTRYQEAWLPEPARTEKWDELGIKLSDF